MALLQAGVHWILALSPGRAVGHMMSTMFYPLVTFVLLVICIAYWVTTALYPLSKGPFRSPRGWGTGAVPRGGP